MQHRIDFTAYSLQQLQELEKIIQAAIAEKKIEEIAKVRELIFALAARLQVSIFELLGAKLQRSPKKAKQVWILFRHPEQPHLCWAGRGRKPKWIHIYLATGHQLDELRVPL